MKKSVTFDLVSDRQNLIEAMEARKLGLEPYMFDRDDMYWAKLTLTDEGLKAELTYSIDSLLCKDGTFDWFVSCQYGPKDLDSEQLRKWVLARWATSAECVQARQWVQNLIDAGYYEHGRPGAPNVGRCSHCGSSFEKGTTHPHTYLINWNHKGEKRLIHHHKLLEGLIKARGLTKLGVSGLSDVPSLEELGELEPITIQ